MAFHPNSSSILGNIPYQKSGQVWTRLGNFISLLYTAQNADIVTSSKVKTSLVGISEDLC